MSAKYAISASAFMLAVVLTISGFAADAVQAYRICTFKGTVVDHSWRSMMVQSNGQCAEVNVGWRTKYLPNRRPCIGERVAVDFMLEEGYMKAIKVVSLSPFPASVQCYPPPPPRGSVCRSAGDEGGAAVTDACPSPRAVCSTKPPAHVTDRSWSPDKAESADRTERPGASGRVKPEQKKSVASPRKVAPDEKAPSKEKIPAPTGEEKRYDTLSGEVVASSPRSLSIRVADEGEAAEVVPIRVGLKTKFVPFRRPAVGERVKVDYLKENGDKVGYTVQVVQ
jgi:hypothetical protein